MSASLKKINVCIVGLSVANMVSLKVNIRDCFPDDYELNWSSLAEPDLDLLVIHADFIQARSVQKILSYRKIPVLKIVSNSSGKGLVDHTLHLPVENLRELRGWLLSAVLFKDHAQNTVLSNPSSGLTAQHAGVSGIHKIADRHLFERLHSKTLGVVKLMDSQGLVGIADTNKELFWPAKNNQNWSVIDHTLEITYSTSKDMHQVNTQPIDLRQWLWQTVWHSKTYSNLAQPNEFFRLLSWPQPAADASRREILQLAAWLSERVCNVQQLSDLSQVSLFKVQHFVSAMLAAGFLEQIPEEQVPKPRAAPAKPEKEVSGWRGLFSKLRTQLGM